MVIKEVNKDKLIDLGIENIDKWGPVLKEGLIKETQLENTSN